jgi:hypothetical protein
MSTGWRSERCHEHFGRSQTRLVIVCATGMVGGYALHYALDRPAVGPVTAIGQRKVGVSHPKLKEVLDRDYADCAALANTLSDQDAAVFSLVGLVKTTSSVTLFCNRRAFDEIVFHPYYSLIAELFKQFGKDQDLARNVLLKSYRTVVSIRSSWLLVDGPHAISLDRLSQRAILFRVYP